MSDIIKHDSLEVDSDGFVIGSCYSKKKNGNIVDGGVHSYTYERNGEKKINHVPSIVISDETGSIIEELHAWDSSDPNEAIQTVRQHVENGYEYMDSFIS